MKAPAGAAVRRRAEPEMLRRSLRAEPESLRRRLRAQPEWLGRSLQAEPELLRRRFRVGPKLLRRASDLAEAVAAGGVDQLLPVAPELLPLLPVGGLRRGSTVAVTPGTRSLVLALLAGASASGAWAAVVGMPRLGILAAAQAGVELERLALVPHPGPEWTAVVAALLDGVDVVVVAPPGLVSGRAASRLTARARQRGSVLMPYGWWEGADLTLAADRDVWEGLGEGCGRLRCRKLTITVRGRGAAGRPRSVRVQLPDSTGRLAPAPPSERPVAGRPALTVIPGEAAQLHTTARPTTQGRAA